MDFQSLCILGMGIVLRSLVNVEENWGTLGTRSIKVLERSSKAVKLGNFAK